MRKLCILTLILSLFISFCNNKHKTKSSTFDKQKFLDSLPEPMLKVIPDSMKSWVDIFNTIRKNDQKYRSIQDPSLLEKNKKEQLTLDSVNQKIVDSFLKRYGYPNAKKVGIKAMSAINMVIQHAPLITQEKYYDYVKDGYSKGEVPGETLALLEDRINIRNNRKQYYGTQLIFYKGKYFPYPVVNLDSLYFYRKKMKMPWTMDYYLNMFKTKWDSVEYRGKLPALIEFTKITDSASLHFSK